MAKPKLYIIGTPLGNRNDVTLRALETLTRLKCFFVEDSREFRKLLDLHSISAEGKWVHSFANHNMKEATEKALTRLREEDVGLCSDRGMPGISDPGAMLVDGARRMGVEIVPVPGPSSVTTLLASSGFPVDRFLFLGFLPKENKPRRNFFELASTLGLPLCFFESPKRIRETVQELKDFFVAGEICFGREMTKLYESFVWERLETIDPNNLPEMGEYTAVLAPEPKSATPDWEKEIDLRLKSEKEWAKEIAERHQITAKEVYNSLQQRKSSKS